MNKLLLDTDVASFFFKNDTRSQLYRPYMKDKILVISFVTVAELEQWALERNWGYRRKEELEKYIRHFVVCPFDRNLCHTWAEIRVKGRKKGHPIPFADAWIAATALLHDLPLATHNRKHYNKIEGLTIVPE